MSEAKEQKKTAEDFAKAYNSLVDEYGFQIVAQPQWVQRDDGSFSTTVTLQVVEKREA